MATSKPLYIIISNDNADQVHLALMAASGAARNRQVALFFTKGAIGTVTTGGWEKMIDRRGKTGPQMDHRLAARAVADTPVMIDACMALGVRFIVCEDSLKEERLTTDDLIERPVIFCSSIAILMEEGEGCDWLKF